MLMSNNVLFDTFERTDATPARPGESRFMFLNRTASLYFSQFRGILEEWLAHVPLTSRQDLIGRLRGSNPQHEAAFWELYLHEGFRRSGYAVEVHPDVPGSRNHPDFRMTRGQERFYVEAVSVGKPPSAVAEDRRLEDVHRVLDAMSIRDFTIGMEHHTVGPRSLATKKLRATLRYWVQTLDPDVVQQQVQDSQDNIFDSLPELVWEHDGWLLVFQAFPLKSAARGIDHRALGVMGPGEAAMVDNVTGLRRVLDAKSSRYGHLDLSIILAVQSNTEVPTYDYQVEQALFGVASRRPNDPDLQPHHILEEGFWRSRSGWRRRSCPQVITIYGLTPWTLHHTTPRVWSTLEPGASITPLPSWIPRIIIGEHAQPEDGTDLAAHFGLDASALAAFPDFDVR